MKTISQRVEDANQATYTDDRKCMKWYSLGIEKCRLKPQLEKHLLEWQRETKTNSSGEDVKQADLSYVAQ